MFQNGLKERIYGGWKTLGTGVSLVNYGGDIGYQHGIIKTAMKFMLEKKRQRTLKTGNKMKMYLIHGFLLHCGRFQRWVGLMKMQRTLSVISQQTRLYRAMISFSFGCHE